MSDTTGCPLAWVPRHYSRALRGCRHGYSAARLVLFCLAALTVTGAQAEQGGGVRDDPLGDLRLFFTADERRLLDLDSAEGSVPSTSTSAPATTESASSPAATQRATPAETGKGRSDSVGSAPGFSRLGGAVIDQPVDHQSTIVYTGRLQSDQGDTWLINGLPWRPGWLGVHEVRGTGESGQVIIEFDDGTSTTVSLGESVPGRGLSGQRGS